MRKTHQLETVVDNILSVYSLKFVITVAYIYLYIYLEDNTRVLTTEMTGRKTIMYKSTDHSSDVSILFHDGCCVCYILKHLKDKKL